MNLPPQYSYSFTGQAKTLGETGYYFMVAFTLSITFMDLSLAAPFESWMQPIAILMALPVTIPFGMLSLVLFHTPIDLYAMFGRFMLVGIVKKNGILQVDATKQLRAKGESRNDAIIPGASAPAFRSSHRARICLSRIFIPSTPSRTKTSRQRPPPDGEKVAADSFISRPQHLCSGIAELS